MLLLLAVTGSALLTSVRRAVAQESRRADRGIPVTDAATIRACSECHQQDDQGRMSRISYMRKTPEGWEASIRRMVALNDVNLDPEAARQIVRYLANRHGIAPEELRPARWEVERRVIDFDYENDDTERTCIACHSIGRVMTQRRTREEWKLLTETHRGYYPLIDRQVFRRAGGATDDEPHPVDKAIQHLAQAYPLETPEWSAWSVTMRPPRLAGSWLVSGYERGKGPLFGRTELTAVPGRDDEFNVRTTWVYAESGRSVSRSGRAIVYTGYQWRGRSSEAGEQNPLREVMLVERDWAVISGRWFGGDHDESGLDVTLRRIVPAPLIAGVHPHAVRSGSTNQQVRVYGAGLPANLSAADVDFGPGVRVTSIGTRDEAGVTLTIDVDANAAVGARDLVVASVTQREALVVYDRVDRIAVEPEAGMARVGGGAMPKQYQQFDAVAYHNGADGRANTEDDVRIGRVAASWSLVEYPRTYNDDDIQFVGSIDQAGLFTPALDGPNPNRSGNRNNVGDVWAVATYSSPGAESKTLTARAHLLVTVPVYLRWEPWPATAPRRSVIP